MQELEAHIKTFDNLRKVGLPAPIIPDVDGLHHDWKLDGKKIQAKVARKEDSNSGRRWRLTHQESSGSKKRRAPSYGAYDALWVHCGDDQFVLLPVSILRRHRAFLGQGVTGKGRMAIYLYHGFEPTKGDAPKWKKLCAPYVCSWDEDGLKNKVKRILGEC